MAFKTDIKIAREASKKPIQEIGTKLGIEAADLVPYGHDKAKVSAEFIKAQADKPDGKLILVTAINPTLPAKARQRRPLVWAMDSTPSARTRPSVFAKLRWAPASA